jgi:hypothetical protein
MKILKIIFLFILLCRCTEPADYFAIDNFVYYQRVDNKIIVVKITEIDRKSINKYDTLEFHFNKSIYDSLFLSSRVKTGSVVRGYEHPIDLYGIFNISDTTSYIYYQLDSLNNIISYPTLYSIHFKELNNGIYGYENTHTINISSESLRFFKKDYSMLERFKEYYQ